MVFFIIGYFFIPSFRKSPLINNESALIVQ
jgi:hypothetical protein